MRVVFRTDASSEIGSGHVMRCLTLAAELRRGGASAEFVCRSQRGDLCDYIEAAGFPVNRLRGGIEWFKDAHETAAFQQGVADWVVIDHYAISLQWENAARRWARTVMVIDDLADRPHNCELLVDVNYYRDMATRYVEWVPSTCKMLLGPQYALLRPEFAAQRARRRRSTEAVKRIFVFFAGVDRQNQTAKAISALQTLARPDVANDIVVGSAHPQLKTIEELCARMPNTKFHCQISNMAELMAAANLAIGGAGGTTWERIALGLPTIAVVMADNQRRLALDLHEVGGLVLLGDADQVSVGRLHEALVEATRPGRAPHVCDWLYQLVDGEGAGRVATTMFNTNASAGAHGRHLA